MPPPFQPVAPPPPPPPAGPPPAVLPPPEAGPSTGIKVLIGGLAVAVVVLVGVIFAYVWAGGGPAPTAKPTATPTQIAAATTPLATATPSPSPTATAQPPSPTPTTTAGETATPTTGPTATANSAEIAAQIDAVVAQVPPIRELDPLRDVPYTFVTRDQFREEFQQLFDDEVDPAQLAAQQRLLQRLGLLPDDADLEQLLVDLNASAVAAYYRPDTGTMYIIDTGKPFGAAERMYVSHEYTHALQDQHFDLSDENRITDPSEGDAALAQLSVIEGDATTTMIIWARENLSFEELFEILLGSLTGTDQQTLDSMPAILKRQLTFPYSEGQTFVTQLQTDGGWAAVNEAVQNPPPSTEQILHPEKFTAHEAPLDVDLADPTADLGGGGWQQSYLDTLGELNMQMFVAGGEEPEVPFPGLPPSEWPHAPVAAGWGGDRIGMWERDESGSWAIAWNTAWDTKADADEFASRTAELRSTLDGVSKVVRTSDTEVLLLMASAQQTLTELEGALTQ
jgi:hypothetical protein